MEERKALQCESCGEWISDIEWHVTTCGSYDNATYQCPECSHEHTGQTIK